MKAHTASPPAKYPAPQLTHYGCDLWPLGEDCDQGLMAAGHDRRALAAINLHGRTERYGRWAKIDGRPKVELVWATFTETCGCTEADHARHVADQVDCEGCWCDDSDTCGHAQCEHAGLPPCDPDRYAFTWGRVAADRPGALPVTVVIW